MSRIVNIITASAIVNQVIKGKRSSGDTTYNKIVGCHCPTHMGLTEHCSEQGYYNERGEVKCDKCWQSAITNARQTKGRARKGWW